MSCIDGTIAVPHNLSILIYVLQSYPTQHIEVLDTHNIHSSPIIIQIEILRNYRLYLLKFCRSADFRLSFIHYNFYELVGRRDVMCWQCNLEWFLCLCYFDKLVGFHFCNSKPVSISSRHLHTNQCAAVAAVRFSPASQFHSSSLQFISFAFSFAAHTYIDRIYFFYIKANIPISMRFPNGTWGDRFFHSINSISIWAVLWCAIGHYISMMLNTNYF